MFQKEVKMKYFKGIFKGIFFTTLIFFAYTAFGSYSPTNDFIESDINVSFEPQAFPEVSLNENYTPVLLVIWGGGGGQHCLIPFNEQIRSKLNTQEIPKQNSLDEAFAFKQMTNVKPCQADIAQLALDSLDKQANQLAFFFGMFFTLPAVVEVPLYIGVCLLADYVTNKRREVVGDTQGVHISESLVRITAGTVCAPVYGATMLIRWGINDGQDPVLDDIKKNRW